MSRCSDSFNFWTCEILRLCAPGHAGAYSLEGYKTVLILETPIWVAGAAESMKIGIHKVRHLPHTGSPNGPPPDGCFWWLKISEQLLEVPHG